jgi:hypothetical protein
MDRIHMAVGPDSYWENVSGSKSMEIDQNLQINLVSCLSNRVSYPRRYVFGPTTYFQYIFHVRIKLF